jgi:hypothetical protein
LELLGEAAVPALRQALADAPSAEVQRRAEKLMDKLAGPTPQLETLRALRAVEALEQIGSAEARELLTALAKGMPEARFTRETKASLERLARQPRAGGTRSTR